jgi:NAD(P)-dependent dehydrogenase (short-subunit alcohol dehydrogenase family)
MKSSAVEKTVAAIAKKHRRIDILVNNAGLNIQKRSWKQLTPKGVDEVVHGNLSSAFYCTSAVLPLMREEQGRRADPHLFRRRQGAEPAVRPGLFGGQARGWLR